MTALIFILCFLAFNAVTFATFAFDKAQAEQGGWRIRESTLLTLAGAGGSVGAVLGQQLLRHKTRKEPFKTRLQLVIVVQAGLLIGLLVV